MVQQGAWLNSSLLCDVIFYHMISEFGFTGCQNRKWSARRRGCTIQSPAHVQLENRLQNWSGQNWTSRTVCYGHVCVMNIVCCVCTQYRDYGLVSGYSSVGTFHWASSFTLFVSTSPVSLTATGSDCPPLGQSCRSDCSCERATGPWS